MKHLAKLQDEKYKTKSFWDKYSWLAVLILAVLLCFVVFKNCTGEPNLITSKSTQLKPELERQDSFKTVIRYHDSTRVKTIVKHRELVKTILKDSTKCYSEIIYVSESCEDVIAKDSILISSLYGQHRNDSIINLKKDSIIVQKSDSISTLSKKLKWQKLKTKGIIALWVIREAVGVGMKVKP